MPLRITSWNVNGIRNPFSYQPWTQTRTYEAMFDILEADIVVMQETKIQRKDLKDDMVLIPGWDVHFSLPKHKKGYSGVAIYTRTSKCCPIRAEEGVMGVLCPPNSSVKYRDLPPSQHIGGYPQPDQLSGAVDAATLDSEGRCVILEFPAFVLIGVYSPANRDESRHDFRIGFLEALDARVRNLVAEGKQVFLTGDLNVISTEKDTCNLAERLRKEGVSPEDFFAAPSRRLFNHLIHEGLVFGERDPGKEPVLSDLCRRFHPSREGMFTCWDTKKNTRPANNGSRIDYVLCSDGIRSWVADANIQEGLMGSDHCPVFADLSDTVIRAGEQIHILDIMNPEGMFRDGRRQREWTNKDLLPLSARLIPDFDRRRTIKDMFSKRPARSTAQPKADIELKTVSERSDNETSSATTPTSSTQSAASLEARPDNATRTSSTTGPADSLTKRPAAAPISSYPSPKKLKTSVPQALANTKAGPGQRSLKTFFQPKAAKLTSDVSRAAPEPEAAQDASECRDIGQPSPGSLSRTHSGAQGRDKDAQPGEDGRVFDPIEAKESWSKLLGGGRILPKCDHGEACIPLVTKKPGQNHGTWEY